MTLTIEHPSQEVLFDEDLKLIYYIRNFLAFGMDLPVDLLSINGQIEQEKFVSDKFNSPFYNDINIYTHSMRLEVKEEESIAQEKMLFSLSDVYDKIEDIIGKWFNIMKTSLKAVCNLYLGTLYNPSPYIRHNFLNLVQAFESFCNKNYPQEELQILSNYVYNKEIYKKVMDTIEDILGKLDQSYINPKQIKYIKERFNEVLPHVNEYPLNKKIKKVTNDSRYKILSTVFIGNGKNQKDFAHKVAKFRNDLSHGEKVVDEDFNELVITKDKLEILMKLVLLKELGLEEGKIIAFLKRQRKY